MMYLIRRLRLPVYCLLIPLLVFFFWSQFVVAQDPIELDQPIFLPLILKDTGVGTGSGDWPQYQHDAARTGYNPIGPPSYEFQEVWHKQFAGDGIASTAQPIILGNTAFIGTEKGILYALSLDTGTELWQRQLDGAITHTAAATQQAVFIGTLTGMAYALDLNNGEVLWQFNTVGSFGSAVLLVEEQNALYLANGYGKIHALDLDTGAELWQTDLGYSILQSPTYGDRRIYIGAEDLKLYALDAVDGHIIWTSEQLYGRSFHDYAPVYAEGKVIVNVMPDIYTFSTNDLELMKQANVDLSDTKDLVDAQDATLQWLDQNPESQSFYVLDAATGQQPYIPGVLYAVVNSGAQPSPIYANSNLYTAFHVTGPMWLRQYWSTEFGPIDYGAMGKLDLTTGRIVERLSTTPGEFTVDETNNYAAAGDLFIGARCQMPPGCMVYPEPEAQCTLSHTTTYPFTSDLCAPGNPPVYAHNYILHHAFNVLTAYQGQ